MFGLDSLYNSSAAIISFGYFSLHIRHLKMLFERHSRQMVLIELHLHEIWYSESFFISPQPLHLENIPSYNPCAYIWSDELINLGISTKGFEWGRLGWSIIFISSIFIISVLFRSSKFSLDPENEMLESFWLAFY